MDDTDKSTILIVGDWFLDENWLVAKHDTYSSSHTGNVHYLSRHEELDRRMMSLCGTPEILEVLRSNFIRDARFSFVASGVWNSADEQLLQCTICPRNIKKQNLTPYTISSLPEPRVVGGKRICPYFKGRSKPCTYHPTLVNLAGNRSQSTNRIIRCYEGSAGGATYVALQVRLAAART